MSAADPSSSAPAAPATAPATGAIPPFIPTGGSPGKSGGKKKGRGGGGPSGPTIEQLRVSVANAYQQVTGKEAKPDQIGVLVKVLRLVGPEKFEEHIEDLPEALAHSVDGAADMMRSILSGSHRSVEEFAGG